MTRPARAELPAAFADLTVAEYATRSGLSEKAVRLRMDAGQLPARWLSGGSRKGGGWRISEAELYHGELLAETRRRFDYAQDARDEAAELSDLDLFWRVG